MIRKNNRIRIIQTDRLKIPSNKLVRVTINVDNRQVCDHPRITHERRERF